MTLHNIIMYVQGAVIFSKNDVMSINFFIAQNLPNLPTYPNLFVKKHFYQPHKANMVPTRTCTGTTSAYIGFNRLWTQI